MSVTAATGTRKSVRPRPTLSPSTRTPRAEPDDATFDRDYWVRHCEGYRVDGGGGRIGFVDEVRIVRGAVVLRVRMGRLGRSIVDIPADEIAFIVPRALTVWLRSHVEH